MNNFVFDAFGTLFKIDLPLDEIEMFIPGKAKSILEAYRKNLLESTWIICLSGNFEKFDTLSELALKNAFAEHHLDLNEAYDMLLKIYDRPSLFEEVHEVINFLHGQGVQMFVLSNGTTSMIQNALESCSLDKYFDSYYSVEKIQKYKPHPLVYDSACKSFAIRKKDSLFISSNDWDVYGAGQYGLKTVWVNRTHYNNFPFQGYIPDFTATSLVELKSLI